MAGFNNDVMWADNVRFDGLESPGQVTTDGQLLIGSTAAPNIRVGTLTSTGGTITITPGSGTINLDLAGGSVGVDSVQVQAFTGPGTNPVLPSGAGLLTISGATVAAFGTPVRSDSIAANALQIEVQRTSSSVASNATAQGLASFNSAHFTVDANGWVSAINGVSSSSFGVQAATAPGTNPVLPTAGGLVTINGAAVAAAGIPIRSDSISANTLQIEVQRAASSAGTNATAQGLASFNSANFTVDANGWVSAIAGAGAINITPNTGVNVTNATFSLLGTSVAAAGVPLRSNGTAANSIQLEIQRADDFGASSAANAGIASFSNAHFSVDANGFVTLLNGVPISSVDIDAATAPGTDPVLPTAAGQITVTGAQVAAGTTANVIRTNATAANSYRIEVQRSSAQAVSTIGSNGVCHFNSAQFTVDGNGFVSTIAGTAPWLDTAGGAVANHTGYFVTAAAAVTLPAGAANGDMVEIVDVVGGGVIVTAQGGNFIQIQNTVSSANGTATSTQKGDSLRLSFRLADLTWYCVPGAGGNWILA